MRKLTLAIILGLIVGIPLFSQAGSVFVQLSFDGIYYPFYNYPDYKNDGSYKMEVDLTYYISNRVAFSTGLEYETKKFMKDYQSANHVIDEEKFDLRYFIFPLQLEIEIFKKGGNSFSTMTGFELGRLISKDRYIKYQDGTVVNEFDDYYIDKFITNFALGLSYRFIFTNNCFLGVSPNIRFNVSNSQGIHGDSGQGTALSYIMRLFIGYKFK